MLNSQLKVKPASYHARHQPTTSIESRVEWHATQIESNQRTRISLKIIPSFIYFINSGSLHHKSKTFQALEGNYRVNVLRSDLCQFTLSKPNTRHLPWAERRHSWNPHNEIFDALLILSITPQINSHRRTSKDWVSRGGRNQTMWNSEPKADTVKLPGMPDMTISKKCLQNAHTRCLLTTAHPFSL